MTPREADEAAQRCLPVVHEGITYSRIVEAGYKYNEKGMRSPFVTLLDKCGHSVTQASTDRVSLAEKPKCVICGAEIEGHGNDARPVKDGRCCDSCNMTVVVPARIAQSEGNPENRDVPRETLDIQETH